MSAANRHDLVERVLGAAPPPFALLHRPETAPGAVDVLVGPVTTPERIADIPSPTNPRAGEHEVLALLPYNQIAERGYECVDDGAPLVAMTIARQERHAVPDLLARLPRTSTRLDGERFDVADEDYAELVRRVSADEIGAGQGANFVLSRSFMANISDYDLRHAFSLFARLLEKESGAYWTFLISTPQGVLIGASPERHVSLAGHTAVMNPISGTYRYPPSGPELPEVMEFLADRKEAEELYMVVDEELKMMARFCSTGGRLVGPFLKEMARLAHTEYFIEGHTRSDPRQILRETMFAPTVTGSPLENACRVIAKHETSGRRYYSGVAALIGRDDTGSAALDSAIMIRTAEIDNAGAIRIGVGATLVRHSDPDSEVAETRAKTAGILSALDDGDPRLAARPEVMEALASRNDNIASYWLADDEPRRGEVPALAGKRVLVVDAADTFTSMIGHQLNSLGLAVTVCRYDEPYSCDGYDLVVMGPGPGDPRDDSDEKIAGLSAVLGTLLAEGKPFLAVCLSHQILSRALGLEVARRQVPNQGVQRDIELFGTVERVGFYNAFAAHCDTAKLATDEYGVVEVSRDAESGEVHALRGTRFASQQFHAESVLTTDGLRIVGARLAELLGSSLEAPERPSEARELVP